MTSPANWTATQIQQAIVQDQISASAVIDATLQNIQTLDPRLNCFTECCADSAQAAAQQIDQAKRRGETLGPLAGVPFAVKNLFDIQGIPTLAGSKINVQNTPATQDATAIARLKQAGAILVGTLNMDEYAYGFVTINHHYGTTPNPHDLKRISGGSSGGSAAAVAGGLVPLTLGSDTNGSIRVPAALCGVYGFKPTYGRLSRAGAFLFSSSLDHIGPFSRSVADLALAFDALQGPDPRDPVCTKTPAQPVTPQLSQAPTLRMAVATDHFQSGMQPEVAQALEQVVQALNIQTTVTLPESDRARAAAYIITASEGAQLHLPRLRQHLTDFDPATCDRFLAGALIPSAWYLHAQRFRRWYRDQVRQIFQTVDLIIAPTTPCTAPQIDQETMEIAGQTILVRPHLGLYTQPLSFIGLPVLSIPIQRSEGLPIGIQLIAPPYQEAHLLQVAAHLEATGICAAPIAPQQTKPAWYIVKPQTGPCQILSQAQLESLNTLETVNTEDKQTTWGPFDTQDEAIARRIGLIRAGKCLPE
jgi:AtzE family amidohydrolase